MSDNRNSYLVIISSGLSAWAASLAIFGLDIALYMETKSYAAFAMVAIASTIAGIVISPFTGLLTDKLKKGITIIFVDILSFLTISFGIFLFHRGIINAYSIGALCVSLSISITVKLPAIGAAVTMLTSPGELRRVNGLAESLQGGVAISGAMFATAILSLLGTTGLLLLVTALYLMAIVTTSLVRQLFVDEKVKFVSSGSFLRDLSFGFEWIYKDRVCRSILILFTILNFSFSIYTVTVTPYILANYEKEVLALLLSSNALFMIIGGQILRKVDLGPNNLLVATYCLLFASIAMTIYGMVDNLVVLLILGSVLWMCVSIAEGTVQTVWQQRVPAEYQGRVFSVRKMVGLVLNPIALTLSIPMSHAIFAYLADKAITAAFIDRFFGGENGSLGVMIFTIGSIAIAVVLGFLFVQSRNLDTGVKVLVDNPESTLDV